MTDWSAVLANAFHGARKNRGDTGGSGGAPAKSLDLRQDWSVLNATTGRQDAGTVGTDTSVVPAAPTKPRHCGVRSLDVVRVQAQCVREIVPVVPAVTAEIHSLWARALDRLRSMSPPESFGADRWGQLLADAERFFQRWANRSELLDWSDRDLLGVHPHAPAARYDAMGLLLLIRGGEVVELQKECASIKSKGGSSLVYRKYRYAEAVPLWQVR
jgi:hypothetical protein